MSGVPQPVPPLAQGQLGHEPAPGYAPPTSPAPWVTDAVAQQPPTVDPGLQGMASAAAQAAMLQQMQQPLDGGDFQVVQGSIASPRSPAAQGSSLTPRGTLPSDKPLVIIPLCRKGDRAGIEKQVQAGATVCETDIEGNTPLHVSVQAPKNEIATVQCLLENGANVNVVNYIGAAPLHYVCLRDRNHRGIANILLENGAEIDRVTLAGKSPLHFACEKQLPELVEVLCLFAANTNLQDFEGNTPMHLAIAKDGGRDTVKHQILEHLIAHQAEVQVPNLQGLVPLHVACRAGCVRCVQLLMERSANVQALTSRQETCLHLACLGNHAEVTQLVVQANPPCVDAMDAEGNTALHICATVGGFDCAALLLRSGADTNVKNLQKRTAFDVAKIRGTDLNSTHNPDLVQLLKDAKKGGTAASPEPGAQCEHGGASLRGALVVCALSVRSVCG
eukprot:CAMPEP_0197901240 /NCGR_PEP_ID=MMETSP1439-20131203/50896_1 /TAXON_ID=66791 /ORGANISM="Gonyaulax spinifera, Strain CCMP409" /LENGTH=446 /DNA_ID=CAMNT_0043522201 /DNA_START=82 /DNA_END=1419 /DNA_ORIENTATION=-